MCACVDKIHTYITPVLWSGSTLLIEKGALGIGEEVVVHSGGGDRAYFDTGSKPREEKL